MGNHKKKNANKPSKKGLLGRPIYTKKSAVLVLFSEQWFTIVMLLSMVYGIGFMGSSLLITQSEFEMKGGTVSIPEARITGLFFLSFSIYLFVITIKEQVSKYGSILVRTKPRDKKSTLKDYIRIAIILLILFGLVWVFTIASLERVNS